MRLRLFRVAGAFGSFVLRFGGFTAFMLRLRRLRRGSTGVGYLEGRLGSKGIVYTEAKGA